MRTAVGCSGGRRTRGGEEERVDARRLACSIRLGIGSGSVALIASHGAFGGSIDIVFIGTGNADAGRLAADIITTYHLISITSGLRLGIEESTHMQRYKQWWVRRVPSRPSYQRWREKRKWLWQPSMSLMQRPTLPEEQRLQEQRGR